MRSHWLKVVIKSGDKAFYWKPISELYNVTCHMAPVICATPATLQSHHIIILLKIIKSMIMTQEIKTICTYQLLIFVTGLGQ